MSSVKRVYVEKKTEYAVQAKALKSEMKSYLGIKNVENVRVLIRYDIENISDATFETACNGIFSEPPVDTLYKETFEMKEGSRVFSVEDLPGQFDQRADSAVQCVQFIKEDELPVIKSATTYVIEGSLTDEEFEAVKAHCINPVDSRETGMEKPDTLITVFEVGLKTTFIPPKLSATIVYSPSASSAKLSIPINTLERDIKVFIVTDLPAPDLANITML